MTRFVPRVCAVCRHSGGTVAYRYQLSTGRSARGYFHPPCFAKHQQSPPREHPPQ